MTTIFPNGEADLAEDVEKVSKAVNRKLTTEECRHIVTTTRYLLRTSQAHRTPDAILCSIIVRSNGKISREEAKRVYVALGGPVGELYSGGDGLSQERPIIINATSSTLGIPAEYDCLRSRFGEKNVDWTLVTRTHGPVGGREIEAFTIRLRDGTAATVHFDISAFYNKR